ncbi:MAG: sigma-70 family RNA polymerase sigma factor [Acidobacteria bacterium]|nr:sigma-70 family RNA polymerase sigma factor [Acidobacteriota bacterium]
MEPSTQSVTELLVRWRDGDSQALEQFLPKVYEELHRLARGYFQGESSGHTLQATALVHEAYLRLVDQQQVQWQNRAHFFGVAAQMMRRILVDHARRRKAEKRGGEVQRLSLDEARDAGVSTDLDLLDLDQALTELADFDPEQSRIVELRFFAGLKVPEVAEVLSISPATVKREWSTAKAWLFRRLHQGTSSVEALSRRAGRLEP